MKKAVFLFLIIGFVFACSNPKEEAKITYKEKMQEVIDVHDEVMPKMSKISSSISSLEKQLETSENPEEIEKAIADLKYGYDFMMEWMRDFSTKFPNALKPKEYSEKEYKEQIALLKEEKTEVLKMKKAVNSSLEQADKLINKNK